MSNLRFLHCGDSFCSIFTIGNRCMNVVSIQTGYIDITPSQLPIAMAGFGRGNVAVAIADPLECNIALFTYGRQRVVLATFDCLFVGASLRAHIAGLFDVNLEYVVVAASHTHYAPAMEDTKPLLGACNAAYMDFVKNKLSVLAAQILSEEAKHFVIGTSKEKAEFGISRRMAWPFPHIGGRSQLLVMPGIENMANDEEPIPNFVRLASIYTNGIDDKTPSAVIWSMACHPTRFHKHNAISSDFVGKVRSAIRAYFNKDIPVLFLQGFSGDIIPRPLHIPKKFTLHSLLFGPRAVGFTAQDWKSWSDQIAQCVIDNLPSNDAKDSVDRMELAVDSMPLKTMIDGGPHRNVEASRLTLGPLSLVLTGAEVVSGFEESLPDCHWPIGCAHEVYGYWPIRRHVAEGGYEADGFFHKFGLKGRYNKNTELVFGNLMAAIGCHHRGFSRTSSEN